MLRIYKTHFYLLSSYLIICRITHLITKRRTLVLNFKLQHLLLVSIPKLHTQLLYNSFFFTSFFEKLVRNNQKLFEVINYDLILAKGV